MEASGVQGIHRRTVPLQKSMTENKRLVEDLRQENVQTEERGAGGKALSKKELRL